MQFTFTSLILGISTLATAISHENDIARSPNGLRGRDTDAIRWHVPQGMTVQEAQSKCGDQAQLSCCNKATYAGDTTDLNAGALSNVLGAGSGAEGLGLFDQCSKLDVQVPIAIAVAVQDILDQRCKQNVACCANSPSSGGVSLPCVALGSIL